ncbi:Bgt-50481 [Blumeria graminis f. sp. tritici]|uniref:Bgt-50481 n=1 Tax=Blumeria graminis f. sp. tritici TaxID=62690 RepID=A0A9X9L8H3_BLUGR|nr:Bgt-50481 [Blumeria graminis f. sp. tritici]
MLGLFATGSPKMIYFCPCGFEIPEKTVNISSKGNVNTAKNYHDPGVAIDEILSFELDNYSTVSYHYSISCTGNTQDSTIQVMEMTDSSFFKSFNVYSAIEL